ncbi:MAG: GGDEF domain-containing protein [Caulobacter sp.]|nr:GGDEF domain-containing protein [Caulobacter sp.]
MLLDTSTLYLVATLVAAMLGLMLLFFGRQEQIAALNWWGAAYLLGAGAIALWTLAGPLLGEPWSLALNAFGFIACGLVWSAARVFHGRDPNWLGLFAGAAAWLVIVFALHSETTTLRVTIGAAIIATYAALTAAELYAERRRSVQKYWPTMIVPLLHGGVLMLPVVIGEVVTTHDKPFEGSVWAALFAIELVLYAIGTVFVIFMLVSERTVRAHKVAASIDPLTGLLNRRGFAEATTRMIAREAQAGRAVTVLIFDIDHFKSINDRFGHPAGDEILKLFSSVITHSLRITDLSGRIGGEEFAAMLPCSIDEATIAAERVRVAFATSGIAVDDAPVDTTVSIGIAGGPIGTDLDVLLAAADTALYQAKRAGRNRIETATEEPLSLDETRRLHAAKAASPRKPNVVRRAPGGISELPV